MLEIKNVKVYDLKESVIACRNAMRLEMPDYTDEEFEKSLIRAKKLVRGSRESDTVKCHDNFLTGIRVSFDVKYPGYWTPEFQRYHFADIVTSSSKMHRLTKMNMETCFNEYVTDESKTLMTKLVDDYNIAVASKDPDETYKAWMRVISNCPMGIELFMRVSTNYKQLQTIYFQRKNHKLKEDWGEVCKMIESLPYSKELILGELDGAEN